MKIQPLNMIASLLLVGALNSSCNSCNEKKDPAMNPTVEQETTTETNPITTSQYPDTADEANGMASADMKTPSSTSKSSASMNSKSNHKNTKITTTKGKKGNRLSGYGAADGTDAENHDGDQYTRNDTTHMPSGSIK